MIERIYGDKFFCPMESPPQRFVPAFESKNPGKIPFLYTSAEFKPGTLNVDMGGGKIKEATNYLNSIGVTNLIYDPFVKSKSHNRRVVDTVRKNFGADTVTCSHVLNYIVEPYVRAAVVRNCFRFLKAYGVAYFTIREGDICGIPCMKQNHFQLNWPAPKYMELFASVFPHVKRHEDFFICYKYDNRRMPIKESYLMDNYYYSF